MLYTNLVHRRVRSDETGGLLGNLEIPQPTPVRDLFSAPICSLDLLQQHIVDALDAYMRSHNETGSGGFRGKQANIFQDTADFFRLGLTQGFVKVPPRVGKSALMAKIARATNIPLVIGVPSIFGVGQMIGEFQKFAPDLSIGAFHGQKKQPNNQIVVGTYNSLVTAVRSGMFRNTHPMLFKDEGHHGLTDIRLELLDAFRFVISWSATDRFNATKAISNHIEHCIHYMTLREAIDDGLLAEPIVRLIQTHLDISAVPWVQGKYDEKALLKIMQRNSLAAKSAELHLKFHADETGLGFCGSIDSARYFAETYEAAGLSARAVSGDDKSEYLKESLELHKSGELKNLFCADLLVESYDNPRISVIHGLTTSHSPVFIEQSRTRALTLDPLNPNKKPTVYEYFYSDKGNRPPGITLLDILDGTVKYGKGSKGASRDIISYDIEGENDQQEEETPSTKKEEPTKDVIEGLNIVLSEVEARKILAEKQGAYQKMMVFSPRSLLRLGRAIAEDHNFKHVTIAQFFAFAKDPESKKYLEAADLPRWPAGQKTLRDYFGPWQVFQDLVLTHAEVGRIPAAYYEERSKELMPVLRMIEEANRHEAHRFWSLMTPDGLHLDQLEEQIFTELPKLISSTYQLDDPAITEWLTTYNRGHLLTMAQEILRRQNDQITDPEDLMLEGLLVLIQAYRQSAEKKDPPDRLEALMKAYQCMLGAQRSEEEMGMFGFPISDKKKDRDRIYVEREPLPLVETDRFTNMAVVGSEAAQPVALSTLLHGESYDSVGFAAWWPALRYRERKYLAAIVELYEEQGEFPKRADIAERMRVTTASVSIYDSNLTKRIEAIGRRAVYEAIEDFRDLWLFQKPQDDEDDDY